MFVAQEARLPVPLSVAHARVSTLIRGSRLVRASEDAYDEWVTGVMRVGPAGSQGISRLVHARFLELVPRGEAVVLTLRWEVTGPAGGLFPALDADITLSPDGDQATRLRLDGAYRPPFGAVGAALDRAMLNRVAAATIRSFVGEIADAIVNSQAEIERGEGGQLTELPAAREDPGAGQSASNSAT
jgi:hypothetical protein